jgi:hypothetical protein
VPEARTPKRRSREAASSKSRRGLDAISVLGGQAGG